MRIRALSDALLAASLVTAIGTAAATAGCGGHSAPRELRVMSYGPQRAIDKAEPIELRFDQPAVSAELVGAPALPTVVAITPAIPWQGYWQDRQTLVIQPTGPLAPDTRYEVALSGDLALRAGAFSFAFVHRPLEIEGVWGIDANALPTDGDVPISFNVPVRPRDAAQHCKLVGPGRGSIALVPTGEDDGTNLTLRPLSKLEPGGAYTLECAELTAAGGNAPIDKPYVLAVHARPKLAVANFGPLGQDVSVDQADLTFDFTTPVELDAVRKALASTPKIPGLDQGTLSADGTEYKVTADLEVTTDYTIRLKNLVDRYGQALPAPYSATFHTGDAQPRLSMERGIFALEASAPGYPLWSRNVGHFDVQCAQIPKERLVQTLTTDMNYDPWGGNDDDKPIDWTKLHVKPKTQPHKTTGRNKWLLNQLDLGATCGGAPGARGVYLAEVTSNEVQPDRNRGWFNPRVNRVLANVTDLGVMLQAGTSSGILWVTSLATGKPVPDAQVAVFTPEGKQVFTGTTNADGLLKLPGTATLKAQKPVKGPDEDPNLEYDWDNYRAQRMIATVEKAGDLAVVDGNWSNGIQTWNFGLNADRSGGKTRVRGFIQSDRGLYRPGELVHFKGLVREIGAAGPVLPAGKTVALEVTDSRGQVVKNAKAKLSPFGGFALDFDLSSDAVLGDYFVRGTLADQTFQEQFTVEEFRPAAFELKMKSTRPNPRPGDRLGFDLDASYLFGGAVADAKVEWNLRRRTHEIAFPGFAEYTFSANPELFWWHERREDYGELVGDGEGTTDAHGHLAIATRDPAKQFDGPVDYILGANVTDSSDQTIGKSVIVTAHQTQLYLGMHANEVVQAVGMPFGVNLVALKPDGTRAAAKAHLSFIRDESSCDWFNNAYRSYTECKTSTRTMIERDVDIADGGSHTERIDPTEPGEYTVKLETKDAAGHPVVAASEIWVIGKGEAFWSGDEGDRMTVVASKPTYEIGDTARLVAQANLPDPTALVTIERDGIIDARVIAMTSASQGIELPIVDAWAPNVFASIAMVSGRHGDGDAKRPRFKMGMVELKVASAAKQLDVALELDHDHVRPGEPVSGKITVTHHGQPVKAEVSLSAADEGVLQLIAYQTPNPMTTFYAAYGLGVDAATNWNRVARLADPNAGDPDQGGDRRSHGDQRVRSKFVASAFWAPMLVTDEHGEVAFKFTAPDNLTAFRLMAIAADAGEEFGAGELRLTVDKPLMAQPALPRFLTSGDSAVVGVVIQNHTAVAGTATVTATAAGVVLDARTRQVPIDANGSARVRFVAKAGDAASAKLEFAVALGDASDDVAVTIPIEKPRVIDSRSLADGSLDAGSAVEAMIAPDPQALTGESQVTVTVDRTGVGALQPSLRALVEYPYGCLEQTMSKLVPLMAAKDLARSLDDPTLRGTRAEDFIHAGIAKIIRHQQGDGLFSLWPQSQTYPHLAAYALWGLTVAQRSGEDVPSDVFDRGLAALQKWANEPGKLAPGGDGATLAMTAYVLALRGKPDAALDARLYAIRTGLPKWGQAFLLRAMALAKADPKEVTELEQLLVAGVAVKDGRALVHETGGRDDYEMYWSSDARATAMALAALLDADPKSPLVDPLANGLLGMRDQTGAWGSTQENLWGLVALAQYAERGAAGETTATISVGGKPIAKQKLTGGQLAVLHVPLAQAAGKRVAVAVDRSAHVSMMLVQAKVDGGAAESHGFTVARGYWDEHDQPVTTFAAGQLVHVKLHVDADANHRWVAVKDPLPAGLEIVDPKLATSVLDPSVAPAPVEHHWRDAVSWDYHEAHDDRALWFADMLPAGHYDLDYVARATIAGTFTALPATVEAMYSPDVHGRSAQASVTVTK